MSNLGDRMKLYEEPTSLRLQAKTPVVIRVDGRSFHTYTRGAQKPYDGLIQSAMQAATWALCSEAMGAVIGFQQSDELTVILQDWQNYESEQWFGGNVQKIATAAVVIATNAFNAYPGIVGTFGQASFDGRVHNIPYHEIVNHLIWRQQDTLRNSVSTLAQNNFSHKQLQGKSCDEMKAMLLDKGVDWVKYLPTFVRHGFVIRKQYVQFEGAGPLEHGLSSWIKDFYTPLFSENREYVTALFAEI